MSGGSASRKMTKGRGNINATRSNAITASSRARLNRTNPFCDVSAFNIPLKAETCQQIHADALRRVTRNPQAYAVPPGISVDQLREQALRYGQQVFLAHPEEIERLFKGVTFSVYRAIESLYCSRLGRTYTTVNLILRHMALEADMIPVETEAVWAICMHLEDTCPEVSGDGGALVLDLATRPSRTLERL